MRFSGEKEPRLDRDFCRQEKQPQLREGKTARMDRCGRRSSANLDQVRHHAAVVLTIPAPGDGVGGA